MDRELQFTVRRPARPQHRPSWRPPSATSARKDSWTRARSVLPLACQLSDARAARFGGKTTAYRSVLAAALSDIGEKLCWTSLRSARNLRGPHVAREQQQLSTDICCGPAPDLGSKPAGCRRCCCQSTGQTDGRTARTKRGVSLQARRQRGGGCVGCVFTPK